MMERPVQEPRYKPKLPPITIHLPSVRTALFSTIVLAWLAMQVAAISIVLLLFFRGDTIPDLKVLTEILLPIAAPAALIIGYYLGEKGKDKDNDNGTSKG